jgi:hypothetical protein
MDEPRPLSIPFDVPCRARAVVDKGEGNQWVVEVWGDWPHDFTRRYEIDAKSDTMAAQEGIRRFVDEMREV